MQGWKGLRRAVLGISVEETSVERRGFRGGDPAIHARLEEVGRSFLFGFHAALEHDEPPALAGQLELADPDLRGWVYEGAGMGLTLLDLIALRQGRRFERFLADQGDPHAYMLHVGAGWAIARIPWGMRAFGRLDPLLRWLALDGWGFHAAYFHWPQAVVAQERPGKLRGYALRVFDQGVGRALWFVEGAEVDRIAATIDGFPAGRRSDLWSGAGLACGYAGGAAPEALESLRQRAGDCRADVAQGVAFAAKARLRAGSRPDHTELACRMLCGVGAEAAAAVTDETLPAPGVNDSGTGRGHDAAVEPAYEVWRRGIRERLSAATWIAEY